MKSAFSQLSLLIVATSALLAATVQTAAADAKESMVKAAFIYNFVKFVEWPGDKAVSKLPNIDICTVSDGDLMSAAKVFKAASTDKLKLTLMEESSAKSAASHCHIVFIGGSSAASSLAELKSHPVLTVSDSENFVEQGGMIGFVVNDNKIKIAVNTKAVSAAGLRVDAQLLEIALKVIDK